MLAADPGAYLVTGNAATLTVTGAVTGPGIVIGGDTTLVHVTGGDLVLAAVTGGHMSSDNTKMSGGTTGRVRALGGDRTTAYASSGDRRSDP